MQTTIYAIYDTKAEFYNKPFYLHNDDIALRSFLDIMATPDTDVNNHPADFTLVKLGVYEDTTASFEMLPAPEIVANGFEVKNQAQKIQIDREAQAQHRRDTVNQILENAKKEANA